MVEADPAAVVVPLDETGGELRIGFVSRANESTTHGDDIGFPGGTPEPTDTSMRATAVRELHEETALTSEDGTIGRPLDAHRTRSSGFRIHPFVGTVQAPALFQPDSRELAATFWVQTGRLRAAYGMDGDRIRYLLDENRQIWGVTARVVTSLLVTCSTEGRAGS